MFRNVVGALACVTLSVVCFNLSWRLGRRITDDKDTNVIYAGHLTSRETNQVLQLYKSFYPRDCLRSITPSYFSEYDFTVFTISGKSHVDEAVFSSSKSRSANSIIHVPYVWNFVRGHDLCTTLSDTHTWLSNPSESALFANFVFPRLLSDVLTYETCDTKTVSGVNFDFYFDFAVFQSGVLRLYVSHDRGATWTEMLKEAKSGWATRQIQITAESNTVRWRFTASEPVDASAVISLKEIKIAAAESTTATAAAAAEPSAESTASRRWMFPAIF